MNELVIIDNINKSIITYNELSTNWQNERSIIIAAINKNIHNINHIPACYYNDFEIMLMAVKLDGLSLSKVSKNLIQNYYIVAAAVKQHGLALKYVFEYEIKYEDEYDEDHDSHGSYRTFVYRHIIDDSKQNFINKYSIVLSAVKNYGYALKYASTILQADRNIVLVAVSNYGSSIQFASANLQRDYEIIFRAVRQDINVLYVSYLPIHLRNIFIHFKEDSIEQRMNYLFEKINNGLLLQHAIVWLKLIPLKCHKELLNWININLYYYENLFSVLFYKHLKFNHIKRLGYNEGILFTIRSFIIAKPEIYHRQKIIIKDIMNELQYYN